MLDNKGLKKRRRSRGHSATWCQNVSSLRTNHCEVVCHWGFFRSSRKVLVIKRYAQQSLNAKRQNEKLFVYSFCGGFINRVLILNSPTPALRVGTGAMPIRV
jgi:hypothetical protein